MEVTPLYGVFWRPLPMIQSCDDGNDDDDADGGVGIDVWSIELSKEKHQQHAACSIHPAATDAIKVMQLITYRRFLSPILKGNF